MSLNVLPFLYALAGFGLLITIHEFGHFIFCKIFGVHTPTFSIGMGPTIFRKKIGETNFRLALIPIGGYVEIGGLAEVGQGDQAHAHDIGSSSFSVKPYWQRFFILMGGILFNLIFAYFVFIGLFLTGMPIQKEVELVVKSVSKEVRDNKIDLQVGDKILSINRDKLSKKTELLFPTLRKLSNDFEKDKKKDVWVKVLREKRKLFVKIPYEVNGKDLQRGLLGGSVLSLNTLKMEYKKYSLFEAIKNGIKKTHAVVLGVFLGLKMLVSQRSIKGFGGPVRILGESFKMAKRGFRMLFNFLALISVNLAVINFLPIGAVDGGQLLFETVEAVIRRKIPYLIRMSINIASWVLILGLIILLTYQDIISLFFK